MGGVGHYGALVERSGFSAAQRLVIDAVPRGARVLDVGCASGHLAAALRDERGCDVVGVEADAREAAAARAKGIDVRVVDVESERFNDPGAPDPLDATGFDCVVFADVLEHLRDPAAVLRRTAVAPLVVVSVPNAAHWTARRELLRGRFPQEDWGLFDRTHLHFFTRATARDLAHAGGRTILAEQWAPGPLPLEHHLPALARFCAGATARWPALFAFQIVLTLE